MWKKVRRPQEEKSRYIKRLKKCWIYKENQDMKKLVSTDFSAENWLILGKKWSMMIATADKYGCRTLPMRNWHNHGHTSSLLGVLGVAENESDITYEELTLLKSCCIIKFLILFCLSDITYEELTQSDHSYFPPFPTCTSDITYEELTQPGR